MVNVSIRATGKRISDEQLLEALAKAIEGQNLKKVLLLPPDMTRLHSYAGKITAMYYQMLKDTCQVDIMPALGTHDPMSEAECLEFFGPEVPYSVFVPHRWKDDIVKIGTVPAEFVREVSEGLIDYPIDVEVNKRLLDPSYDLIISVGQVVPHEVVGMANYSKNIFVGCGGKTIINRSHFLGAVYGMERVMGKDFSPVRKVFDYAETHFIKNMPLMYILTVTTVDAGEVNLEGLYIGRERFLFENALEQSQQRNLIFLDRAPKKVVVYLDEREFKSTWLGNKSVYRTRMAIADDGELLILAPGVRKFGEDAGIDQLIRKYGYVGRMKVLEAYKQNEDLQDNLSAAAHLIHGSSDGRFSITYAVENLTREEVEGVNFNYMQLSDALARYNPAELKDGWNTLPDGEEIFYISNPAIGLWADRKKFMA
ncbi:MAG: lactate racemase domain-containing protein [Clostridiales bacterium]|nr:lactate racemase domain-containing protein [Clostridiales bacterium]